VSCRFVVRGARRRIERLAVLCLACAGRDLQGLAVAEELVVLVVAALSVAEHLLAGYDGAAELDQALEVLLNGLQLEQDLTAAP